MAGRGKLTASLVAIALLAFAAAGCGGQGGSEAGGTAGSSTAGSEAATSPNDPSPDADGSGDGETTGAGEGRERQGQSRATTGGAGSEEFIVPGGDNSIQSSGKEAGMAERAAASKALETYMRARAAGKTRLACSVLADEVSKLLTDLMPNVKGGDCVAVIGAIDRRTPPSARANTMSGPIGSLRVDGARGFALYHGNDGADYAIQMTKEDGSWKVASLVPYALTRPSQD